MNRTYFVDSRKPLEERLFSEIDAQAHGLKKKAWKFADWHIFTQNGTSYLCNRHEKGSEISDCYSPGSHVYEMEVIMEGVENEYRTDR